MVAAPGAPGSGGGAPAGGGAMAARAGGGGPGGMPFMQSAGATSTEEDRAKAKLPPPPEEDSELEVLIRPGLLADVEITVEKIPDAIHIPGQGLFEKEGKQIVYVQVNGRFQERPVKLAKRSESTMVIADGLKAGEIIALADPFSRKNDKKSDKKGTAGMPGMPSGGGK